MARRRGWSGAEVAVREAAEDLTTEVVMLLRDLPAALRGEAGAKQVLRITARLAILPALGGRLWRSVEQLGAGLWKQPLRDRKRRAVREAVLQLPLPLRFA